MTKILIIIAIALIPELAFADSIINPPSGGNTWDLYVFGNARVIADVLESIKMLVSPDNGDSGFRTIMLFMGTLGFLVMAIRAGFNPSQNFVQMFMYILMVWMISWSTTNLKMNVHVTDTVDPMNGPRIVQRVPAIVAMPAVLVSQVGNYFTTTIERYFSLPNELKISGERVNGFNLFGKMMSEANQFTFTNNYLKNSVRAYMSDCVIPAMAKGDFEHSIPRPDGSGTIKLKGMEALVKSPDLMTTLATAMSEGIYTKYFPMDEASARSAISAQDASAYMDEGRAMSSGVLVSCSDAYNRIATDVSLHANALFSATSEAWSKTGTMVPLEGAFQAMLNAVGSTGASNRYAVMGSPQGFIQQQAVVNQISGSFRQAAIQSGNSEFLTAANLAQAEQNQKSAWTASFAVFNNMMGYVYSVLQAFIFAIMPIVIIALFVPGLGKGIFTNYSQILIWMALWSPMLAIINYLITLFGYEQIGSAYLIGGGPNMYNSAVVSEKTNDLMIAAQFLGISTPLITWGLVKGSLAFTEFIQSGIGSSFAQQAGASAASGNMSMGNISMDNFSANKFNSAMMNSVGFGSTDASFGAGTATAKFSMGGSATSNASGAVQVSNADKAGLSAQIQAARQHNEMLQMAQSHSLTQGETMALAFAKGGSKGLENFIRAEQSQGRDVSESINHLSSMSAEQRQSLAESVSQKIGGGLKAGASIGAGTPGASGGGGDDKGGGAIKSLLSALPFKLGADLSYALNASRDIGTSAGSAAATADQNSRGTGINQVESARVGTGSGAGATVKTDASKNESYNKSQAEQWQEQLSKSIAQNNSNIESWTRTLEASRSRSFNEDLAMGDANEVVSNVRANVAPVGPSPTASDLRRADERAVAPQSDARLDAAGRKMEAAPNMSGVPGSVKNAGKALEANYGSADKKNATAVPTAPDAVPKSAGVKKAFDSAQAKAAVADKELAGKSGAIQGAAEVQRKKGSTLAPLALGKDMVRHMMK